MLARDLCNTDFPSLSLNSSIEEAKAYLLENCTCHIPIVQSGEYIAQLDGECIISQTQNDITLRDLKEDFEYYHIDVGAHILNFISLISKNHLSNIPVTENENQFLGCISSEVLIENLTESFGLSEQGGIFTLKMQVIDYDLSEIARLTESNKAKIISSFVSIDPKSQVLIITVKVNTTDLRHIQATFDRFGYNIDVLEKFDTQKDDMALRYKNLMRYLQI